MKTKPELVDRDNPEWTEHMISSATTLQASSLPDSFKQAVKRGRPESTHPKKPISIRLSPEVLTYFRATGRGWQTKVDDILRQYVERHQ
ncbi:BrnA antitoxin family protein [Mariprofundus ferrooxydans]|nr:BrnA antitoxin family protein [Mariprofundus ferrooxydans]